MTAESQLPPPQDTPAPRAAFPGTRLLLGINAAIFVLELILSDGELTQDVLLGMGANDPLQVWNGQWWRLLTCAFLHGGLLHVAVNMQALWVLGQFLEEELGAFQVWVLYLGSALLGSASSIALGEGAVSVGASGAVFGFVGALLALTFLAPSQRRRSMLHLRRQLVWTVIINLALGMWLNTTGGPFRIDNMAHLGGLTGGLLLGAGIFATRLRGPTEPSTVTAYVLFALVSTALLGGALHPRDPVGQLSLKALQAAEQGDVAAMNAVFVDGERRGIASPAFLAHHLALCEQTAQLRCGGQALETLLSLEPMPPNQNYPQVDGPQLSQALTRAGMLAGTGADFRTAVRVFGRLAQLHPDEEMILNNLAWFILRRGHGSAADKALALDAADRARRISNQGVRASLLGPDLNVAHTWAEALAQNGRLDEALDVLRGFAALNAAQRWLSSGGTMTLAVVESEMERMRAGKRPVDF